jgi:hypothetical protein
MFYQGKITASDSRYGSWLTPWCDSVLEAETASEKINTEKYQGLGTIKIFKSLEKSPELAKEFTRKYYKYRYFKTDLKTGKNKTYVMDSNVYDESLEGLFDYRHQVETEHKNNIAGLMSAYCGEAAIGFEIVYLAD